MPYGVHGDVNSNSCICSHCIIDADLTSVHSGYPVGFIWDPLTHLLNWFMSTSGTFMFWNRKKLSNCSWTESHVMRLIMMCEMSCVRRWRSIQFEAESAFKLELKNNGVVRRSSQESDVSTVGSGSNISDLYSWGALFHSQLGHQLSFPRLLWLSSVTLGRCYDITLAALFDILSSSLFSILLFSAVWLWGTDIVFNASRAFYHLDHLRMLELII
jgi:hypothetical protein